MLIMGQVPKRTAVFGETYPKWRTAVMLLDNISMVNMQNVMVKNIVFTLILMICLHHQPNGKRAGMIPIQVATEMVPFGGQLVH